MKKTGAYIFSVIFLVLLNLIVFSFAGTRESIVSQLPWSAHLTVLGVAIFQLFTVLFILYIAFKRREKFKRRAIASSLIIYGLLAVSIFIFVASTLPDVWQFELLLGIMGIMIVIGLFIFHLFVTATLLSLYVYYVKKSYIHVGILVTLSIFTMILYIPSLLEGCVAYNYICRLDRTVEKSVLTKNPDACNALHESLARKCIQLYATRVRDVSACENKAFGTGRLYHILSNRCKMRSAIETKDATLCNFIQDTYYRDGCLTGVAASLGDPSICEKISDASPDKICYIDVAVATQNPDICTDLLNGDADCYQEVAVAAKDVTICDKYFSSPYFCRKEVNRALDSDEN